MITTIVAQKAEMSARFNKLGHRIPVTEIVAEPNVVIAKNENNYQIGFGKRKKVKKPQNSIVEAIGFLPRVIKEVKIKESDQDSNLKTGDKLNVSIFEAGDIVKITGVTKGRGFAGGVKRWGFHGGPKTHGQSDRHRAPGSIGQTTTPGRVFKGKKMAGHMGAANLTVTGIVVIDVNLDQNKIFVKGPVPGARNGILIIEKTGKVKKHIDLFDKVEPTEKTELADQESTEDQKTTDKVDENETTNESNVEASVENNEEKPEVKEPEVTEEKNGEEDATK